MFRGTTKGMEAGGGARKERDKAGQGVSRADVTCRHRLQLPAPGSGAAGLTYLLFPHHVNVL